MRLRRRLLSAAAAAALGGAGLVGAAAPSQAAACSSTNGVTVVVQGPNGTQVRCASGDPSSAWGALQAAGFSLKAVQRFPDALCRIDGAPASDPCINMPPASAYWSFWHAPNGGSWTYSQVGIKGWNPKPGSSVGFRFGSGTAPSTAPATVSAPKPTTAAPKPTTATPKPTSTPRRTTSAPRPTTGTTTKRGTSSAAPAPARSPGAAGPTASTPAGPGATPSPSASRPAGPSPSASAPSASTPSPSASILASETPSPEAAQDDVRAAPEQDTGSSGAGRLIGGGALLAGVAAAVAAVAVRRRSLG
ncbi:hypothetical protein [Knoellia sp. LjRoot47]|uniref:hypothetical protein n=1 Tax=Knoellia sp. LjRoot47 TaxID=3342330 RepID=UPI003ECDBEFF